MDFPHRLATTWRRPQMVLTEFHVPRHLQSGVIVQICTSIETTQSCKDTNVLKKMARTRKTQEGQPVNHVETQASIEMLHPLWPAHTGRRMQTGDQLHAIVRYQILSCRYSEQIPQTKQRSKLELITETGGLHALLPLAPTAVSRWKIKSRLCECCRSSNK